MRKLIFMCDECKSVIDTGLVGYSVSRSDNKDVIVAGHGDAGRDLPHHVCGVGCFNKVMSRAVFLKEVSRA